MKSETAPPSTPLSTEQPPIQPTIPVRQNPPLVLWIVSLILLGVASYLGYQNWQLQDQVRLLSSQSKPLNPTPSVTTTILTKNETITSDFCNFTLTLPQGYYFEKDYSTSPFFYGLTVKDANGQMCKIIYGPNYKPGYEGFTGENIQINAYPNTITINQQTTAWGNYQKVKSSISELRYQRDSYGGKDEVFIVQKNKRTFEILWRNQPDDLELIIGKIAEQLPDD